MCALIINDTSTHLTTADCHMSECVQYIESYKKCVRFNFNLSTPGIKRFTCRSTLALVGIK